MIGRLSMEDAAYCAAAWASGTRQKDLAALFGLKRSPSICVAIRQFLNAYADQTAMPTHWQRGIHPTGDWLRAGCVYGDARKALVAGALRAFQRSRG